MENLQAARPAAWKRLLAFAIIYCVWGSTFLAIRIGVQEVPPFLLVAMRFLVAGLLLYGWLIMRGERPPRAREWGSAFLLATCIFVLDYGFVFWAEHRVPSGLTAVMLATIPAFTALSEIIFLRTQRLTFRLGVALLIGLMGVVILMSHSVLLGGAPIEAAGAAALMMSAMSWSVASALMRKLPQPESKAMSAGSQMLAGSVLLGIIAVSLGELRGFHFASVSRGAWLALAYLIVFGAIIAFTAYVLANSSRVAHEGGDVRVCEPGDRGAAALFFCRRAVGTADDFGDAVCAGGRGGDHDDAGEENSGSRS